MNGQTLADIAVQVYGTIERLTQKVSFFVYKDSI